TSCATPQGFPELATPRWRHAAQYGFDEFGHGYIYVTGGQDAANGGVGTTELTQVDVFGLPGPWHTSLQLTGSATAPDAPNTPVPPRTGATLLRVGRYLYAVGGASVPTDTSTAVSGSQILNDVESAQILGFETMPQIHLPTLASGSGLPIGTWY